MTNAKSWENSSQKIDSLKIINDILGDNEPYYPLQTDYQTDYIILEEEKEIISEKNMSEIKWTPELKTNLENRINRLFRRYVSAVGNPENVCGEIIRSYCRLFNRYINDGDILGDDPALNIWAFMIAKLTNKEIKDFIFNTLAFRLNEYDDGITEIDIDDYKINNGNYEENLYKLGLLIYVFILENEADLIKEKFNFDDYSKMNLNNLFIKDNQRNSLNYCF